MKRELRAVDLWLMVSSWLVAGGWLLSLARQLNGLGYGLWLAAGAVPLGGWLWQRLRRQAAAPRWGWRRFRRRFSRPLPLGFLLLALLAVGGGLLYAPNNIDALTYRVPRMLNWLAEGRWHWIHTSNFRMNIRACNSEWVAMPLLVLTKSERAFFLINGLSFLLLPGLIYSTFTRLGVRRRVAWSWMWLLPSGYGFVLQAGGDANDLLAAPYALAAVDCALRARLSKSGREAWLSVLAAALLTGTKATNLPLLLPWAAALAPSARRLCSPPTLVPLLVSLAGLVSFLPTAMLNGRHCGDWAGGVLENGGHPIDWPSPPTALAGNALQLAAFNLVPPVFPLAPWWNERAPQWLPPRLRSELGEHFEKDFHTLGELQVEEAAGLGFGLSALLLASLAALAWRCPAPRERPLPAGRVAWFRARARPLHAPDRNRARQRYANRAVRWLAWAALLVYLCMLGAACNARLLLPYYGLLLPLWLCSAGQDWVVRQRWWRRAALGVCWLAALVLVLNPARPMWPAQTLLSLGRQWKPEAPWLHRAQTGYRIYGERFDALAPVRRLLPADARLVGFASAGGDPETSLWRPLGQRRLAYVLPGDTWAECRQRGLEYVVVSPDILEPPQCTLAEWLARYRAEVVGEVRLSLLASKPPRTWVLATLPPEP